MIRRIALGLTLVLLAFVAPQPTHAQDDGPPEIEEVPLSIVQLLTDYARAYRDGDADLLERTVADRLIAAEREAFANARNVPFSSYEIRPNTQYSGDLASTRVKAQYKGREVVTYHVVEESKIGPETTTYADDGAYTFIRGSKAAAYDGWRLASKNDLDPIGFFSPYHLWNESEVVSLSSDRFLMLTHPDVVEVMRPVMDIAERAYDRVGEFWPRRLRDRYVIIAPSTTEELGRIMHETVDLGKFVAFVSGGADRSEGWEPTGPRVFIHLSHLRRYSPSAQTEIIAHELVHAVTREVSGPNIPVWVEEGLANLGGGSGRRTSLASTGGLPDSFPSDDRFVTGPVRGIQASYDQSQVAIETLEDRFGPDGLADFYTELGSRRVVVGTEEYHVRAAVKDSVGWTHDEWVAAWRRRLG